jgi:ABC-type dipeptide/oligopeptide/nickel transport system permease subunit
MTPPATTEAGEINADAGGTPRWIRRYVKNKGAVFGAVMLGGWILVALFAPWIMPHDPYETLGMARQPPSEAFWFGTDLLGRDLFSRVLLGSRVSLQVGLISVALGAVPGVLMGLFAGYFGGTIDTLISRFVDAMLAFPSILLALIIIASLGPSLQNVMIAVGIGTIPQYARLVRGSVLSVKSLTYVEAARVVGNRPMRIMFRHVLANAYAPVVRMGPDVGRGARRAAPRLVDLDLPRHRHPFRRRRLQPRRRRPPFRPRPAHAGGRLTPPFPGSPAHE